MNTTLNKRFVDLENALMPEKNHAYLQYYSWQQTEQEAIDEWNIKNNTNFTREDFSCIYEVVLI